MTIQTLHGDCRELLETLEAESVQTIVTSPPYWRMRRYTDDPREIGQENTPAAYVAALTDVFARCWRVLRNDGTLWLNLGDGYANDGKWGGSTGGKHAGGIHGALGPGRTKVTTGLPPKSLIGMPWRVAFALQDAGWILRTEIVWEKPNAMPESVTDRPTRSHEYVFLFAKSPRYFYDAAAISEPIKQSSIDRISQPNFANQTGGPKDYGPTSNRSMRKTLENFAKKQDGHGRRHEGFNDRYDFNNPNPTRNARTVWSIPTTGLADEHYAPMPQELAERCIRAGSTAGDTVLDPFGGSGTTARAALALQRKAVLIDLGYQDMQARRTDGVQVELFV
jgi:DNA modification methylase